MNQPQPDRTLRRKVLLAAAGALFAVPANLAQQTPPAQPATAAAEEADDEEAEVIVLSPFQVDSTSDMGYYASSTLSGTRLNARIRDLGASISVVTAQQLTDTASVDVNDIFLYEANTEGTHTYTEYTLDRGSISTTSIQMSPQTATRLRGIGQPDRAVDYFISLDQIPLDSYNLDRVTINRGPNSVLFGLGSAAGLVNTSPAKANIGQDSTHLELRVGSWGDYRGVFNTNQTLKEDMLAVRVAGLYHERGFQRQPSHDYMRRGYFTTTYQPWRNTAIRLTYEGFINDYRRPNANTPQDFISRWEAAGRPTFNPSTMMITRGDGTTVPLGIDATEDFQDTLAALSNGGLTTHPHNTRAAFLIEDNQAHMRIQRQLGDTVGGANLVEQVVASAGPDLQSAIFTTPGINRRELYDWEEINILSGNYGKDTADIYQVTLEQQITPDLFVEVGYRKESFERFSLAAQSGNQAAIYVDVNETLLDGTPNPFFLKPYIEVWEPTGNTTRISNEAIRGTAAYELDFSENDGWLRWLGRHNLMGFAERRDIDEHGFRWREAVISTHEWAPAFDDDGEPINKSTGSNFRIRQNRVYYLGDNARITKAPGDALFSPIPEPGFDFPVGVVGPPQTQVLRHFVPTMIPDPENPGETMWVGRDGSTDYGVPGGRPIGNWVDEEATFATILHDTNPPMEQTEIESYAGLIQSYLWDERIVTTFGWRKDTRKFRRSDSPIINDQGFRDNVRESLRTFPDPWDEVSGTTQTRGVVFHPFRNWDAIPEWLQGLGFHYNESDTFTPATQEVNLFLETLPVPTGEGKDYGFSWSTMNDRLVVRVNWYESAEANSRVSAGLVTSRARRVENENNDWAFVDMIERDIERREGLEMYSLDAFEIGDPATAPYLDEIAERSGLSVDFLQYNGDFSDNRTVTSKGMEISLDYNPSQNWNLKFTAGRQKAVNSNVEPSTQRWLFGDGSFENPAEGSRLWYWQNAEFLDPRDGQVKPWWTTEWPNMPTWGITPQAWYTGVVESLLRQEIRLQGLANPQVREWRWALISNYRFTEGMLRGLGVGGSVQWEDKAAIGYMGLVNPATGVVEFYDVDNPIFDESREYFDFWVSYTWRIMDDDVRVRTQLNVRNAFEDGGLQVFAANPDGSPAGFRIREPRSFYLTLALDF